jgi:hypothetical protein
MTGCAIPSTLRKRTATARRGGAKWDGAGHHTRQHLAAASSPAAPGSYAWAVEYEGHCIGSAGLAVNVDEHCASYTVGVFVAALRGQGLGQEITWLVLSWAFTVLGLHRVELEVLAQQQPRDRLLPGLRIPPGRCPPRGRALPRMSRSRISVHSARARRASAAMSSARSGVGQLAVPQLECLACGGEQLMPFPPQRQQARARRQAEHRHHPHPPGCPRPRPTRHPAPGQAGLAGRRRMSRRRERPAAARRREPALTATQHEPCLSWHHHPHHARRCPRDRRPHPLPQHMHLGPRPHPRRDLRLPPGNNGQPPKTAAKSSLNTNHANNRGGSAETADPHSLAKTQIIQQA